MKFKIGKRIISNDHDPLIIAEIGINHNGSLEKAINIASSAINSGAEVIKHQTHVVDDEYSYHAKKIKPGNSNKDIYSIMKQCSLSEEDEFKLMKFVHSKNRIFLSTPFSRKAADRLFKFKLPAIKIGSGECNNHILIEYLAKKKIPLILSTGMNDMKSVSKTVSIINKYHNKLAILHCTNVYPANYNSLRLNSVLDLIKKFKNNIIGYSDHSKTIYPCLAAVSLGALIIEKHFIDNKKIKGPDIQCSMDPKELNNLINASKIIKKSIPGKKYLHHSEIVTSRFAFASIVASKLICKNEKITLKNITAKRPGTGDYLAYEYKKIIGKKAVKDIYPDEQLRKSWIK